MDAKPTPQYDDRPADASRDFSAKDGFSLYALERMLRDCADQPTWRLRAKLCAAYYDGKQLTELQRWQIREEDLEERVVNLIRPVINSVLGQEAKSRTDVRIEADDDEHQDVAEVISQRLKEAEREALAHQAVSDGYGSGVKKGLGWVHVDVNSDPLLYRHRVEPVPIDEIWWDWRGLSGTRMTDRCRWVVRQRMIDLDEIEAAMPEHSEVLRRAVNGWDARMDIDATHLGQPIDAHLLGALDNEARFNLVVAKRDWVDSARKMIKLYEVWYRVPAIVAVLHLSPTKRVQYDETDPRHVQAVSRGLVRVTRGVSSTVRRALYAGPYRLLDEPTRKKCFPYIPFFAFRDDEDLSPYGLIDGMIAPQDDFNDRRQRIQWMLKSRQIQMDSDALDTKYNTIADIADQIMRPDMVAITNPNRQNKNQLAIRVENTLSMQPEQFQVMADAKQLIQDAAGRYSSQLGSRPSGVTSGIANSLLIEQGEQSMGEMNDNYGTFRRQVFETLVDNIIDDLRGERMAVHVGTGKTRRVVVLNDWDPQTNQPVNYVADADIKTALAETPNTPAYRQQQQQQLASIIQALGNNPQATAILAPAYLESTNVAGRQELADELRKIAGIPLSGDKAGKEKAEMQAQQDREMQAQAQRAALEKELAEKDSVIQRNQAAAQQHAANAALIEQRLRAGIAPAEVGEIRARTEHLMAQASNDDDLIAQALQEAEAA